MAGHLRPTAATRTQQRLQRTRQLCHQRVQACRRAAVVAAAARGPAPRAPSYPAASTCPSASVSNAAMQSDAAMQSNAAVEPDPDILEVREFRRRTDGTLEEVLAPPASMETQEEEGYPRRAAVTHQPLAGAAALQLPVTHVSPAAAGHPAAVLVREEPACVAHRQEARRPPLTGLQVSSQSLPLPSPLGRLAARTVKVLSVDETLLRCLQQPVARGSPQAKLRRLHH